MLRRTAIAAAVTLVAAMSASTAPSAATRPLAGSPVNRPAPLQLAAGEHLQVDVLGDSLTEGLPSGHPYTIELGQRLADAGITADVTNLGVGGDGVGDLLSAWPFIVKLTPRAPHLIIIDIGTNDAAAPRDQMGSFEGRYRTLIDNIRRDWPTTQIIATWLNYADVNYNNGRWRDLGHNQGLVNDAVYRIMFATGPLRPDILAVCDLQTLPSYLLSPPTGPDGLHPGPNGYDAMGRYYYRCLRDSGWLGSLPAIPEEFDYSGTRPA